MLRHELHDLFGRSWTLTDDADDLVRVRRSGALWFDALHEFPGIYPSSSCRVFLISDLTTTLSEFKWTHSLRVVRLVQRLVVPSVLSHRLQRLSGDRTLKTTNAWISHSQGRFVSPVPAEPSGPSRFLTVVQLLWRNPWQVPATGTFSRTLMFPQRTESSAERTDGTQTTFVLRSFLSFHFSFSL